MKVALLQICFEPRSPAANIQRIGAAIDRAAQVVPPPDLLVLPGACDTGGAPLGRSLPEAVLRSAREGIASKAREWGVFITAGLHQHWGDGLVAGSVLFDPDGDVVCSTAAQQACKERAANPTVKLWHSTVGDLGVFDPAAGSPADGAVAVSLRGAFVALPLCLGAARDRRLAEACITALRNEPKARSGAHWGVVAASASTGRQSASEAADTFLCRPDGSIAAAADTAEETVVYAEVAIAPASPEELAETSGEGCDAD